MADRIREKPLRLLRARKERYEELNPGGPLREGAWVESGLVAYQTGIAPGTGYYELVVHEFETEGTPCGRLSPACS